jgi:hypothetical protein
MQKKKTNDNHFKAMRDEEIEQTINKRFSFYFYYFLFFKRSKKKPKTKIIALK